MQSQHNQFSVQSITTVLTITKWLPSLISVSEGFLWFVSTKWVFCDFCKKKKRGRLRLSFTCNGWPTVPAGKRPSDFHQVIPHGSSVSPIIQMTPTLLLVAFFEGCTHHIPGMPLCLWLYISLYRKSMRWNSIEKKRKA